MRDIIAAAVAGGLFLAAAVVATAVPTVQTYLEQAHVVLVAYPSASVG